MSYDGKKNVLSDCSFSIEKGTISAIVGESGSGKTTLLRLIAGLERPQKGTIKIAERVVSNDLKIDTPQERQIGFVFQDFALFPHLTVEQNIAYGLKENKAETIKKMLTLVKMEGYAKVYPSQLSGGQEQRIALARTLATNPKLLLLDEPFSNLDTSLKSELRTEIRKIVKTLGITVIFITHDLYDALDIADDILFLKKGKLLQHTNISQISTKSQHEEVNKMIDELKHNAQRILNLLP